MLISCGSKDVSEQNDTDSENVVQSVSQKEIEKKVESLNSDETVVETTAQFDTSSPETEIEINTLTDFQFIDKDSIVIDQSSEGDRSIVITWKTLEEVEKIEVSFSNPDSNFPDDVRYRLQKFKPESKEFTYNAAFEYEVLDIGRNVYTFYASKDGKESVLEVILNLQFPYVDGIGDSIAYKEKTIGLEDDSITLSFPYSWNFGSPLFLGVNEFTYTDIEGLYVTKADVSEVTCENVTEYLTENIGTWFFWNTCRDVVKDKWISFYVIELAGEDEYLYKKHYLDYVHGLYATLELERGEWVTSDNISDKNKELKESNTSRKDTKIVDDLMKKIILGEGEQPTS